MFVNRWLPSSKTCSFCGWKKDDFALSDREFHCENCGQVIDRDLNAAINIKNAGLKQLREAIPEATPVEMEALAVRKNSETVLVEAGISCSLVST